jgi:hypothetical protein
MSVSKNRVESVLVAPTASLSMEENADGKINKEIEHMFYGYVNDFNCLLDAASVEVQQQWGIWQDKTDKNVACGSLRVRKTTTMPIRDGLICQGESVTQYVMTTKIKTASGDALEVSVEVSSDSFKAFKLLAESGMVKHRYVFPVKDTNLKWEVDMFPQPGESCTSTKYQNWAKIDLEVPSKDDPIPEYPAGVTNVFEPKTIAVPTPEQKEVMEKMKSFLSLPNPYVNQVFKNT